MEKFLLTLELRYDDAPESEEERARYVNRLITIGVYETREEANESGNCILESIMEKKFSLNRHHNGKERFSSRGGCFGTPKYLITELGYLNTPFSFFFKVEKLNFFAVEEEIDKAVAASERFRNYMKNNE